MPHITLCVTNAVLAHVTAGHETQRQIAIREASPEIVHALAGATADHRMEVNVNGNFPLTVGDTNAIWESHQTGTQTADFADLFSLLARRPGTNVRFMW